MTTKEIRYQPWVWVLLIGAPLLLFALSALYGGIYMFLHPNEYTNLGTIISDAIPYILLINHTILLVLTLYGMKKSHVTFSSLGIFGSEKPVDYKKEIFVGAILGAVLVVALHLLNRFLIFPGHVSAMFSPSEGFPIVIYTIAAVIVAPVVEELLYRGYAFTVLKQKFGLNLAVILSSLFFSFLHFGEGLPGLFTALVVGVVFCITYSVRKSLWHLLIAHAVFNLISILFF